MRIWVGIVLGMVAGIFAEVALAIAYQVLWVKSECPT